MIRAATWKRLARAFSTKAKPPSVTRVPLANLSLEDAVSHRVLEVEEAKRGVHGVTHNSQERVLWECDVDIEQLSEMERAEFFQARWAEAAARLHQQQQQQQQGSDADYQAEVQKFRERWRNYQAAMEAWRQVQREKQHQSEPSETSTPTAAAAAAASPSKQQPEQKQQQQQAKKTGSANKRENTKQQKTAASSSSSSSASSGGMDVVAARLAKLLAQGKLSKKDVTLDGNLTVREVFYPAIYEFQATNKPEEGRPAMRLSLRDWQREQRRLARLKQQQLLQQQQQQPHQTLSDPEEEEQELENGRYNQDSPWWSLAPVRDE